MNPSDLEELRRLNKSLLARLTRKREEFRERNVTNVAAQTSDTEGVSAKVWRERLPLDGECSLSQRDPPLISPRGLSSVARKALSTPQRTSRVQSEGPLSSTPEVSSHILHYGASEENAVRIRSPVKRPTAACPMTSNAPPTTGQYVDHLMDEGNMRTKEPRTPKSILMTPNRTPKRDPGRVTFLSSTTAPESNRWVGRPLLGYDWIAGLLEVNSGVTNKSDEFFSDINEFRRVNREECVHESISGVGIEDASGSDDELDVSLDTHQCVYCYRVNSRLFTSPVGAEPACPVCKKRRGRRRAAMDEPAYIRVSIPRSTLLPPYKYRAHRRKSFDPTDTLALPSHCLAGWENANPSCGLRFSSLDLKTSVDPSAAAAASSSSANVTADSVSYYAARARSDNLLNVSRSIHFHHGKAK